MSELQSTAMVTGGSRGIGSAIAKKLAADGYMVYMTYVSKPELAREVCSEIEAAGGRSQAFELDISDADQVQKFFNREIKDQVRLQVLVNNAGLTKDGLLVRMKRDQWEDVLRVNLSGTFYCLQQGAKIMMRQKYGRIINLSSVTAQAGNAGQANYTAAKAGIIGLTKSAAQELAPRNITVNAVAPGFVATDMTAALSEDLRGQYLDKIPVNRFGTPEDIAAAVSFLASPNSGYITGQVLGINGGMYM
ncbi:MAG: 3-oxoacyl-[acyl-carrier-protein] reductase [Desulfonatronovibrionaceae bacterium]